jgi:hypothetical protein
VTWIGQVKMRPEHDEDNAIDGQMILGWGNDSRSESSPIDWLAKPGKSEHRWVEIVALAQLT